MTTVLAFVLALGLLIAIHEYGHYRVAVACGIKVLRFSIGFGRPVLRWRLRGNPTEFVIGLLPLGGYVRMLDEREAPVEASERHLAFNTQPLRARVAVVAAGPLANLLLAAVLYAAVSWIGVEEPQAIVSTPAAGSAAERGGLRSGDWVLQAAVQDEQPEPVRSFDDLRWRLAQAAFDGQRLLLVVQGQTQRGQGGTREVWLDLGGFERAEANAQLFRDIGVVTPWSRPVMGQIQAGGAADKAGLQAGDLVLRVDGRRIDDAAGLREMVRQSSRSAVQLSIARASRLSCLCSPRRSTTGAGASAALVPSLASRRRKLWCDKISFRPVGRAWPRPGKSAP
jgi:regulator of sigma E protease